MIMNNFERLDFLFDVKCKNLILEFLLLDVPKTVFAPTLKFHLEAFHFKQMKIPRKEFISQCQLISPNSSNQRSFQQNSKFNKCENKEVIYISDSLEDEEVSNAPKIYSVHSWSVEKVCQWIRIESVYEDKKYDSMFRENGIDGFALMNMEKCNLEQMGIKLGRKNQNHGRNQEIEINLCKLTYSKTCKLEN
jgi:hypothetical protein